MTLANLLGTACVITRRTAGTVLDSDGNQIPTTTTGTTTCSLQRTFTVGDEPEDEGEFSATTWKLFLPTGTGIDTSDKVTVGGLDYEVVGAAWDATEGTAAVHHVEARVKRTA